jgi:two-component system chemotaxis sensor kinase CheA
MRDIYTAEFDEQIEALESALLKLEKNPKDMQLIGEIFRYSHNIKGSSAAIGLKEIAHLAHAAESLMSSVKNHFVSFDENITNLLFGFIDGLKTAARIVKEGRHDFQALQSETQKLQAFLKHGSSVHTPTETATLPAPAPRAEPMPEPVLPPSVEQAKAAVVVPLSPSQPSSVAESNEASHEEKAKLSSQEEFIKISARKVDRLIELFGEQVILQSTLDHAVEHYEEDAERALRALTELRKITRSLQLGVVTLRMVSVNPLVNRVERTIRDTCKATGKSVKFKVTGDNVEVDKAILDAISHPLMHLVRNAVDHGIETLEERARRGKPLEGQLSLSFRRGGGTIDIIVEDDGAGLSRDKILRKALELGMASPQKQYKDHEVYRFIFQSGFSTRENANEISGRGVGMDVVAQAVEQLKGYILTETVEKKGTRFICRLPLTLDMFNGTIFRIDRERYVLANSEFKETVNVERRHIEHVGQEDMFVRFGDRVIKLIDLKSVLRPTTHCVTEQQGKSHHPLSLSLPAVVVEYQGKEFGFLVEELLSQEQIVLKRISEALGKVAGSIGCTILGDGHVALIISLGKILEQKLSLAA